MLPDGRKQVVEYEADQEGFKPQIRYEGLFIVRLTYTEHAVFIFKQYKFYSIKYIKICT